MKIKQVKELATAMGVAISACILAVASTHYLTFIGGFENIAADIRIAALQPPMPQSANIAIAGIMEETVTQFPYRSPVDRAFLASLLKTLEGKGAKVVGVDVLFDQATEPEKDELLKQTLRDMKIPVFVSYSNDPRIVNEDQLAYMNDFVPEHMRADAHLATDPFDGTVRWVYPGKSGPGEVPGFAKKAAELMGGQAPDNKVEIAWRPYADSETPPFPVYPSHAAPILPDEWFKDKLVLVGAILSITDRHRTPLAVVRDGDDANMPGILVQAHGVSQFLENRKPLRLGLSWSIGMSLGLALIGVTIGLFKKGVAFNVIAGLVIMVGLWVGGVVGFMYGVPMVPLVAPTIALALSLWMMDVLVGSAERKQREFVQGAFSRYVSPAVVGQLVDNPDALKIQGDRKELTFVFTDVAGFTTMSEKLTSEKLSEVLNAYLDGACEIILRYEGTIDKFIGDAIMSIFNAPIPQADHYSRAVKCALELDVYAEKFREAQNAAGVPMGVTRIGLHAGQAVIGNFGSRSRMDFTALGDTVNTAARCEGVNKYFGTRICCTESVVAHVNDVKFMPVGDVVLKGKLTPVGLFNPISDEKAASELYRRYMETYALLKAESPDAPDSVRRLFADYPDEPLVCFHHERVESGLNTSLVVMEDK